MNSMPLVKILKNYDNTERWAMGDVVDCTNPTQLIKEGKVVLLNEKGEEIAPPGTPMKCPICLYEGKDPVSLAHHILDDHTGKPVVLPKPVEVVDAMKQKRLDNLEKARAARKLNQLRKNVKKHEKEVAEAARVALEATKGV